MKTGESESGSGSATYANLGQITGLPGSQTLFL